MPAVFFGHGSPMNTLDDNRYTQAWRRLGQSLPRPQAVVVVSAHWYTRSTAVTAMQTPRTIHDFYGFPQALFDFQYPAPGSPAIATRMRELLQPLNVPADQSWGLDHGSWSVLTHLFPAADVPIVQLSIVRTQPPAFHYELGQRLAPLRDEGILIVGSGDVVHNLSMMQFDGGVDYDWAIRFNDAVKDRLLQRDHAPLVDYTQLDREALLAVPTPEHYLPLLYVIGTQQPDDAVSFPVDGIDLASISMLTVAVGDLS
ncbi:MAG: 4,5-DOPA dioxygenase extradiol [Gammaproteobacteria bacterium]|nr:4,5-DOPA dioxygenase extradiol [Gammaproteobacteria bacterium]